jgi:two-component system alkaline phosphatase synthesis response regulator PhoP
MITTMKIEIIDKEKNLVVKDSEEFCLPKKEFMILDLLCSIPGKVYSRSAIFENVWGPKSKSNERTVDVHIVSLRKKLEAQSIKTIRGVGYKCTATINK